MSTSEAAANRGNDADDDCPLCLEPLPPFWDSKRRTAFICCGKQVCSDCDDKKNDVLDRAAAEGSYGKQEHQLNRFCPLCRTEIPTSSVCFSLEMMDKFEEGRLPLHMYRELAVIYLKGAEAAYLDGYGGVEIDEEKGMEILMLGAEKGDPSCQYYLGNCYDEGSDGLPKSLEDAKRWWLAAAGQGHAVAEYNLAITFRDEGNDSEYLQFLKGSASKGFDEACFNLGLAYYNGDHGLRPSSEEAIRVLTPAAERGDAESMRLLGTIACCPDPQLPPPLPRDNPNFTKGVQLWRRAAAKGDKKSILNLESMERNVSSKCFKCYTEAPPDKAFLRCSRCRAAWYCSKDCQRRHWKAKGGGHKQFCIQWN